MSVLLATYTGWQLRHPEMGAPDQTVGLLGRRFLPVDLNQATENWDTARVTLSGAQGLVCR